MSCVRLKTIKDGTSQLQRLTRELTPDSLVIDNRKIEEFWEFILGLSGQLNYYDFENQLDGNWSPFFPDQQELITLLENQANKENIDAHLSLILSFIHLMTYLQKDINGFTKKHLDFIYKDVLKFKLAKAKPDLAHLVFELKKSSETYRIEEGRRFDAGKDNNGTRQFYKAKKETILNKAAFSEAKVLYIDRDDKFKLFTVNELEKDNPAWSPFGESQIDKPADQKTMKLSHVGFGIAAPILYLPEGLRTIDISFSGTFETFPGVGVQNLTDAFECYLTGSEDWIIPDSLSVSLNNAALGSASLLNIQMTILNGQNPVLTYEDKVFEEGFVTKNPLLKVLFKSGNGAITYEEFISFKLEKCTINVDVQGVKNLTLFNDNGVINSSKPFFLFGTNPIKGSRLTIGSSEIFSKPLDELELFIDYQDAPINLGTYYQRYFTDFAAPVVAPASGLTNAGFTARARLLNKGAWEELDNTTGAFQIFDTTNAGSQYSIHINDGGVTLDSRTVNLDNDFSGFDPTKDIKALQPLSNNPTRGYLAIEFENTTNSLAATFPFTNFGQNQFTPVYTNVAIGKAVNSAVYGAITFPNNPYIPLVKEISLNYSSSVELEFNQNWDSEQFFYELPFGHKAVRWQEEANAYLLPQFPENGYLFLGLKAFNPPSNISFLFKLEEGSSESVEVINKNDIIWSYLSNDSWKELDNLNVLTDQTNGFQTTGIVELQIPEDATSENTSLPKNTHWISASLKTNTKGVSKVQDVFTQAILVEYIPPESNTQRLVVSEEARKINAHLIPAATIRKLLKPAVEISKVKQPFSSFSGQGSEDENDFYTRVSERIRHKNRSINLWDYERLVLEYFPSIFKVKCINHFHNDHEYSPGHVTLVVVPNLRNNTSERNIFNPRASSTLRNEIQEVVKKTASTPLEIHVENPIYEEIILDFKVGFKIGFDPGFYGQKLDLDIKKYLSPWAFEEGREIIFGNSVSKSDLIAFIEKLKYVDFVNDFFVFHKALGVSECPGVGEMAIEDDFIVYEIFGPGISIMAIEDDFVVGEPVNVAVASSLRSIIVSAAKHRIRILTDRDSGCSGIDRIGLGTMVVDVDFEIFSS